MGLNFFAAYASFLVKKKQKKNVAFLWPIKVASLINLRHCFNIIPTNKSNDNFFLIRHQIKFKTYLFTTTRPTIPSRSDLK